MSKAIEDQLKGLGFDKAEDAILALKTYREKANSEDGSDVAVAKQIAKEIIDEFNAAEKDRNAKPVEFPTSVDSDPAETIAKDAEAYNVLLDASMLAVITNSSRMRNIMEPLTLRQALAQFEGPGKRVLRAMDTAEQAGGKEWFYTALSRQLREEIRLETKVRGLFEFVEMPTNPFKWPTRISDVTVYAVAENTADTEQTSATASQLGTGDVSITAYFLGTLSRFSHELDLRSIIPLLPAFRRNIVIAHREAEEYALINGDMSTSSNITTAGGGTSAGYKWSICDGLRHAFHGDATRFIDGSGGLKNSLLRGGRGKMGKWGASPDRLVYITNVETYIKLLDSISEVQTLDKYGPKAVILTGELAKLDGIPIIVSGQLPLLDDDDTMNASDENNTDGTIICVHKDVFVGGDWDALRIKVSDEPIQYDQTKIASFRALGFQGLWLSSGISPGGFVVYNITV